MEELFNSHYQYIGSLLIIINFENKVVKIKGRSLNNHAKYHAYLHFIHIQWMWSDNYIILEY